MRSVQSQNELELSLALCVQWKPTLRDCSLSWLLMWCLELPAKRGGAETTLHAQWETYT